MKKTLLVILIIGCFLIIYLKMGIYIPCVFYKITHLYCPGCGITRALRSLLNLEFYQAFRYNNIILFVLPVFFIYYLEILLNKCKIQNLNVSRFLNNKFWYSLLIIVFVYGLLRNIPYFEYLVPTQV